MGFPKGDDSAWMPTLHSYRSGRFGTEIIHSRAFTAKGERNRQRAKCWVGLRGPATFSTESRGDIKEQLPWLALAWIIADPEAPIGEIHKVLHRELNMDDYGRRQSAYMKKRYDSRVA